MSGFGSEGLFETKEDGTIVYYGGRRGQGLIVDPRTRAKLKAYYALVTTLAIFVFPPLFIKGNRLFATVVIGLFVVWAVLRHRKLVRSLPVAPYPRPGVRRRFSLWARDTSYKELVLGFLSFPLVWGASLIIFLDAEDGRKIAVAAVLAALFVFLWLFAITMLVVKVCQFWQARRECR